MVRWNHVPVTEELSAAVKGALKQGIRALRIEADPKRPRIVSSGEVPSTASLRDDVELLDPCFEAGKPSVVMLRLQDAKKTLPGALDEDWAILVWMPEEAPTGQKLKYDGLHNSLKEHFVGLNLRSVLFSTKGDASLARVLMERVEPRPSIVQQMSHQAAKLEKKGKLVTEKAEKVRFAIGVAALEVLPQESFNYGLSLLLAEKKGALLCKMEGSSDAVLQDLHGESLDHVREYTDLVGRLPASEPRYVVFVQRPEEPQAACEAKRGSLSSIVSAAEGKQIQLITWLPEVLDARLRVVFSTTKASVLRVLAEATRDDGYELVQAEVNHEDQLNIDLGFADVDQSDLVNRPKATSCLDRALPEMGTTSVASDVKRSDSTKKKRIPKCRRSTYMKERISVPKAASPAPAPQAD